MTSWFDRLFKKSKDKSESKPGSETGKNVDNSTDSDSDNSTGSVSGKTSAEHANGCDHSSIKLRQNSPDFEYFIANYEIENNGDLKHGARHLSNLLSFDPGNLDWLALLDRYMSAVPDPEALIPREDNLYYSTEALRAYLWYKKGRLVEAVDLLSSVGRAKPESQYMEAWLLPWLEKPNAVEQLPAECAAMMFGVALNRFPEAELATARQLDCVSHWAHLLDRYFAAHPDASVPMMQMAYAGLFRKAGLFEKAETIAKRALDDEATWHNATAVGLIMRKKGSPKEAEEYFVRALELDPTDNSARLEAGDAFFDAEDWQAALGWYEKALKKDPKNDWALPSANYCRWMLKNQQDQIDAVVTLANKGNQRAYNLASQAYNMGLPEPADATANIIRQLREKILAGKKIGGNVKLSLSSIEAPSNFLAFKMEMESLGSPETTLGVTVSEIPEPDPRKSIVQEFAEVKYPLWKYEGNGSDTSTDATPALPAPPQDIVDAVAKLANTKYDIVANFAAASYVAAALGPARLPEILAVMVHPPAVPKNWSALSWLPRVQLTAALIIAQLDSGWDGSARKEGLLSILFGPQDWTTQAAIRALSILGTRDEALSYKIDDIFLTLVKNAPSSGYCCWRYTLYNGWIRLPHLSDGERNELQRAIEMMEADD